MFVGVGASQKLLTTAYDGYLIAFAILGAAVAVTRVGQPASPVQRFGVADLVAGTALTLWVGVTLFLTVRGDAALRDILRDVGAVFAYAVGRHLVLAWLRQRPDALLEALSVVGVFVALATLTGAALAYRAGATAYFWRGEYVPMAHSWLPYCLIANIALIQLSPERTRRHLPRIFLCLAGTVVSLSRTDLLLYVLFSLAMLPSYRLAFRSRRVRTAAMLALFAGALMLPGFLQLDVVQQRVEVGVADDDQSLAWRFIENLALLDHLDRGGTVPQLLGYGWGARLPLPAGVEDFDGNDSIPLLHNSYLTIVLKFGIVGLVLLATFLARQFHAWRRLRRTSGRPYAFAGFWFILFVLGKAMTLQGLTEWSHVLFFGIGCALVALRPDRILQQTRLSPLPHAAHVRTLT